MAKEECSFCKKLLLLAKNGEYPYDKMTKEQRKHNIDNVKLNINNPVGWCRGVKLCRQHIETLKKDNKYRLLLGEDIPNSIDVKRLGAGDF